MTHPLRRAIPLALALAAPALALGGAGCKRGKAPDCKAVGAAYATLQQQEIEKPFSSPPAPGAPPATAEQKEQALSLIPLLKETMVKECEEKKWSGETRRCVVEAKTPDDLERCRTRKEDEAAPAAESAPAAGTPAPTGTASPAPARPDSPK